VGNHEESTIKHVRKDIWADWDSVDHFIVTTNAIIKRNGGLVMGAGLAKQVRDKWRGVDIAFANAIKGTGQPEYYGCLVGSKLGLFQVKVHFKDKASLKLISNSARDLAYIAEANPNKVYALNFPGIGNGKLDFAEVNDCIKVILPDNVWVYTKPSTNQPSW
jgi:hypothetical protein